MIKNIKDFSNIVSLIKVKNIKTHILYKLWNTGFGEEYVIGDGIFIPEKTNNPALFKILEKNNILNYLNPNDYSYIKEFDLKSKYVVLECILPNNETSIKSEYQDEYKIYNRTSDIEKGDIIILKEKDYIIK